MDTVNKTKVYCVYSVEMDTVNRYSIRVLR